MCSWEIYDVLASTVSFFYVTVGLEIFGISYTTGISLRSTNWHAAGNITRKVN